MSDIVIFGSTFLACLYGDKARFFNDDGPVSVRKCIVTNNMRSEKTKSESHLPVGSCIITSIFSPTSWLGKIPDNFFTGIRASPAGSSARELMSL